ncbi:Peroxiredoxin [Candidatus Thermokryptus mobilis]|uniref:Peroxiredoxin n=1 Tax=Candidatus Thermokryptus mobilis TaxID=1643428 RepID=A0A0S4NA02_9BACT|nr:TlpA disulfide reductase family protein [Candidatus Thermokryptus mobilis]CUU08114.1 Peroxiredoxin [Candidatus Thermokryptus mobilis]
MRKILLLFSLFLLISCSKKENKPQTTSQHPEIFTLTKIEQNEKGKPPNFYWQTQQGEKNFYELSKGKIILLNFWATWCGPCVKEIPDLIKIKSELSDKNFEIIGVSIDKTASPVAEFAKNVGINYILIHDPEAKLLDAFGGSVGIPITFLIDKDGKIVSKYLGARTKEVFMKDIEKILK